MVGNLLLFAPAAAPAAVVLERSRGGRRLSADGMGEEARRGLRSRSRDRARVRCRGGGDGENVLRLGAGGLSPLREERGMGAVSCLFGGGGLRADEGG